MRFGLWTEMLDIIFDFKQAEHTNNIIIGLHLTKLMEKLTTMPVMEALEPLFYP